jgi:hypothetical protein
MQSICESKGEKLHTRNIEVTTYHYDEQRMIVEGILKDERFSETHIMTGEKFPSGVMHHMTILLLINCSNLLIEDVDVSLMSVPREVCRETIGCLASIKGLSIVRGFTSKVKAIAGGQKGCAHLVELLLAMAPAAIQGYGAYREKKPTVSDPNSTKMMLQFLVNTCHAWREDGPLVEKLKTALDMK